MIKRKIYRHTVPDDFKDKVRLRIYLIGLFPYLETASAAKKAIKKKQIYIDDAIGFTGDWVEVGSEISFHWEYKISIKDTSKLNIIYDDAYLMVVVKPPGLATSGNRRSLQSQLNSISPEEKDGNLPFPYLIHRLDKATEGLMIAAKTIKSRRVLANMMDQRSIIKKYVAIVEGHINETIRNIKAYNDDRFEETEILQAIPLQTKDATSRIYIQLHTGKTHQIRRHLANINHPIVGDKIYNKEGLTFKTGLLLVAICLEFSHPVHGNKLKITYEEPSKISKYQPLKEV